jgi:hypothetical protein
MSDAMFDLLYLIEILTKTVTMVVLIITMVIWIRRKNE